jgi:hypothetical protein
MHLISLPQCSQCAAWLQVWTPRPGVTAVAACGRAVQQLLCGVAGDMSLSLARKTGGVPESVTFDL